MALKLTGLERQIINLLLIQERSTEDFTQRALELMNTSGSGIAYFVMTYSDNTKTTATSAKAKASAGTVGSSTTGKDLYYSSS